MFHLQSYTVVFEKKLAQGTTANQIIFPNNFGTHILQGYLLPFTLAQNILSSRFLSEIIKIETYKATVLRVFLWV
jgi:hypothetical protein